MAYLVTGATGFLGRFLLAQLLDHREGAIHCLTRAGSTGKLDALKARLGDDDRIVALTGDLAEDRLGVGEEDLARLDGHIDHVFHLAAIYDLTADAERQHAANVEGTRHAVRLAQALHAGHFHQISSIAAAGLYPGTFTEDMFDEATGVEHNPYYRTKHESEALVRDECSVPWRVYRPGVVVGHSQTGEIDKIDGPYYFFRAIDRLRALAPGWLRGVGIDGGEINIVPVDFVARALDHLAHRPGLDGRAFHLTDPRPLTVGELVQALTAAASAPRPVVNIDAGLLGGVPARVVETITKLPVARQLTDRVLADLGIPRESLAYLTYPTHFDSTATGALLAEAGIEVPPFESYVEVLWNYWQQAYGSARR